MRISPRIARCHGTSSETATDHAPHGCATDRSPLRDGRAEHVRCLPGAGAPCGALIWCTGSCLTSGTTSSVACGPRQASIWNRRCTQMHADGTWDTMPARLIRPAGVGHRQGRALPIPRALPTPRDRRSAAGCGRCVVSPLARRFRWPAAKRGTDGRLHVAPSCVGSPDGSPGQALPG